MSRLFMTGLEAGHTDVFDAIKSGAVISTTQARTGTYSLSVPSSADGAIIRLPSVVTDGLYVQVALYPTGAEISGGIVGFYDNAGDVICHVASDGSGEVSAYRGNNSYLLQSAIGALINDQWNLIEVYHLPRNSDGRCIVRVNGNVIIDYTGDTTLGNENVAAVGFGATYSIHVTLGYYDDIIINDTAGSVNNSWPGGAAIYALIPNGAGTTTELEPSAGANYQCVDDVPPDDDTSYVESDVADELDTYALSAPVAETGVIGAIMWQARARANNPGNTSVAPVLRVNGTNYAGSDKGVGQTYINKRQVYETNPADDAAWEAADLAALEAGVKVTTI